MAEQNGKQARQRGQPGQSTRCISMLFMQRAADIRAAASESAAFSLVLQRLLALASRPLQAPETATWKMATLQGEERRCPLYDRQAGKGLVWTPGAATHNTH